MKLQDLDRDIRGVVSAPVLRTIPEDDWVRARDDGVIPESLFGFYRRASFFSWDATPRYLRDPDSILYFVLEALLNGIKDCFEDASECVREVEEATGSIYTPLAEARGDEFDLAAPKRQMDGFKGLILNLTSALDLQAEVTALLIDHEIPGLTLGRASFHEVYNFLKAPPPPGEGVIALSRHYAIEYYQRLRPIVIRDGTPEEQWLDLLYLYRNKLAHLGRRQINQMVLPDSDGKFWYFLPRIWPFQWKQHIRQGRPLEKGENIEEWMDQTFLHLDMIEYCAGLLDRVYQLVGSAFHTLGRAYTEFRDFDLNENAIEDLQRNSRRPAFRFFDPTSETS